MEKLEAVW